MLTFKQFVTETNDNTPILSHKLASRLAQFHMDQRDQAGKANNENTMRAHETLASQYHTLKRRYDLKQIPSSAANDTTDLANIKREHDTTIEALKSTSNPNERAFHRAKIDALRLILGLKPLPRTV